MKYKKIDLNRWEEFKEIANNSMPEWIFRGQSNSEWDIRSSLERSGLVKNDIEIEKRMLNDFKRVANIFLSNSFIPKSLIEWLALMQHYGAPTRLIDFTKSPYIAAYFAFENINKNNRVAIWIADKIVFYQKSIYYLKENNFKIKYITEELSAKYTFNNKLFEELFIKSFEKEYNLIFPKESGIMSNRYYLQQSIFLCQANPTLPFYKQLDFLGDLNNQLIKITLPITERKKALRDLEKMNITRASLFPGLEGFTQSLKNKYEILMDLNELANKRNYLKNKFLDD